MHRKLKILFLCTGNSCRSQMAEGWTRHLKGDQIEAYSAGIETHGLNPRAVQVMAEAGVDISGQRSKHVRELHEVGFDYVVTVCGHAHEHCPLFPGKARIVHVGFDDPPQLAAQSTTEEEGLGHYRRVRDEIRAFVETLPGGVGWAEDCASGRRWPPQVVDCSTGSIWLNCQVVGGRYHSVRHSANGKGAEGFRVDLKMQARYEVRARIVKAMAHPTRMFIVDELSRAGERCVCELTEMIGADMSTVSKHLTVLKNAGIILDDKRGNQVYYRLRVPCILEFFRCIESVLECNAPGKCKCLTCK
jgi:arsenate reductase (thioredoxin)